MEKSILNSTFIHYGSYSFDINKFNNICEYDIYFKPHFGGLWASIVGIEGGWRDWCEAENYDVYNHKEKGFFAFKLSPETKLLYIDKPEVIEKYNTQKKFMCSSIIYFDWHAVSKDYDAVYFDLNANWSLYDTFYGVDCASICVFNPKCIQCI